MSNKDKGIRAILPGIVLPEEEAQEQKEIQDAKNYVYQKLGKPLELRAAPTLTNTDLSLLSTSLDKPIIDKLPEEKKDEYGFTKKQNREINEYLTRPANPNSFGAFNREKEKVAKEERRLKKMKEYGIEESSTKQAGYPKNKKNFLKGGITVDPNHPDGFRINDDTDLYDVYGKTDSIRYIQEMAYKYDGTPIKNSIKPFDQFNKNTYPSDPAQQTALRSYEKLYNRLTPLQKKQIVNAKNGGSVSNYKKQFRKP